MSFVLSPQIFGKQILLPFYWLLLPLREPQIALVVLVFSASLIICYPDCYNSIAALFVPFSTPKVSETDIRWFWGNRKRRIWLIRIG